MIKTIKEYQYECDCCQNESIFYNHYKTHFEIARIKGWAISKDRLHCYCPRCAPRFRYTGKKTGRTLYEIKHKGEIK